MPKLIEGFFGKTFFLSNFYPGYVEFEGLVYPSAESAFQAAKSLDPKVRQRFTRYDPKTAKAQGRKLQLRSDWEDVKEGVMLKIVRSKFTGDPKLRKMLIDTYPALLVEENNWNDRYWGVCKGKGKNRLGYILERVRDMFIRESEYVTGDLRLIKSHVEYVRSRRLDMQYPDSEEQI